MQVPPRKRAGRRQTFPRIVLRQDRHEDQFGCRRSPPPCLCSSHRRSSAQVFAFTVADARLPVWLRRSFTAPDRTRSPEKTGGLCCRRADYVVSLLPSSSTMWLAGYPLGGAVRSAPRPAASTGLQSRRCSSFPGGWLPSSLANCFREIVKSFS